MEKGIYLVIACLFLLVMIFCVVMMTTQFKGCFSKNRIERDKERSYNPAWKWVVAILVIASIGFLTLATLVVDGVLNFDPENEKKIVKTVTQVLIIYEI